MLNQHGQDPSWVVCKYFLFYICSIVILTVHDAYKTFYNRISICNRTRSGCESTLSLWMTRNVLKCAQLNIVYSLKERQKHLNRMSLTSWGILLWFPQISFLSSEKRRFCFLHITSIICMLHHFFDIIWYLYKVKCIKQWYLFGRSLTQFKIAFLQSFPYILVSLFYKAGQTVDEEMTGEQLT